MFHCDISLTRVSLDVLRTYQELKKGCGAVSCLAATGACKRIGVIDHGHVLHVVPDRLERHAVRPCGLGMIRQPVDKSNLAIRQDLQTSDRFWRVSEYLAQSVCVCEHEQSWRTMFAPIPFAINHAHACPSRCITSKLHRCGAVHGCMGALDVVI